MDCRRFHDRDSEKSVRKHFGRHPQMGSTLVYSRNSLSTSPYAKVYLSDTELSLLQAATVAGSESQSKF